MATSSINYAAAATLTWGMTNPSSDSTLLAGRQSTSVDNETTDKFNDIIIGGDFSGPSSGAAAGVIEIFAYGSYDGGKDFFFPYGPLQRTQRILKYINGGQFHWRKFLEE